MCGGNKTDMAVKIGLGSLTDWLEHECQMLEAVQPAHAGCKQHCSVISNMFLYYIT